MKKTFSRIAGFAMALSLSIVNFTTAMAVETAPTANRTAPAISEVTYEARETAECLLSKINLSAMSTVSDVRTSSLTLLLSIRAGIDCTAAIDSYVTAASTLLNDDGTLNVSGSIMDCIGAESFMIQALSMANINPASFNEKNLISALSNSLQDKTVNDYAFKIDGYSITSGMNPYYLGVLYTTVSNHSTEINNSSTILSNIRAALDLISNDNGIDYMGQNTDNNGYILPGFSDLYNKDAGFKTLIDHSNQYTITNSLDQKSGCTLSYGTASSDSTALAVAMYSTYGKTEEAAMSYHALIDNFSSTTTPGAYTGYYGTDDFAYATTDALVGLVSYQYALVGKQNIYDAQMTVDFTPYLQPVQPENPSETPSETSDETSEGTPAPLDTSNPSDESVLTADCYSGSIYIVMIILAVCLSLVSITSFKKDTH